VFNVGDKVIHPAYGAGTIVTIEEKQVGEQQRTYYIIELLTQAGTLMVPVARADELGLRPPVKQPEQVLDVLTSEPTMLSSDHRERQELISTDLRSGDVRKISEAVRDLAYREREERLTEADQKLYRQAQGFLAGEIALSQGIDVEAAQSQVASVLETLNTPDESV
jgi:CarD family transcriptional regulator